MYIYMYICIDIFIYTYMHIVVYTCKPHAAFPNYLVCLFSSQTEIRSSSPLEFGEDIHPFLAFHW